MALGLISNLLKLVLALVLFLIFPWLLAPALLYLAWKRGMLADLVRQGRRLLKGLGGKIPVLNASVSQGLASYEEGISYDAPSEDSLFVIVERDGERRMLCAIELRERAAAPSDYGRVVGEVVNSSLQTAERIAFSFSMSRRGGVGGLIIFEYPDPGRDGDLGAVSKEIWARLDSARIAVASAAPLLTTNVCRGRRIALCGLWGLAG